MEWSHPRGKELGVYPPSPIRYWLRSSFWRCSFPAFPMHGLDTLLWSQEVSVRAAGICSERPSLCTENMKGRERSKAASPPDMLQFCNGRHKWDIENTEPCYLWIRPTDFWMLTMYWNGTRPAWASSVGVTIFTPVIGQGASLQCFRTETLLKRWNVDGAPVLVTCRMEGRCHLEEDCSAWPEAHFP